MAQFQPTPPIQRRPMTTKQARRNWQKKGCPTVSSVEKRRLEREAELERRAEDLREKEKRKKENKKKRDEKEARDREKKLRMGVQEEVKLPEGQLGLGQFFAAREAMKPGFSNEKMIQQDGNGVEYSDEDEYVLEDGDGVRFCNKSSNLQDRNSRVNPPVQRSGYLALQNQTFDGTISEGVATSIEKAEKSAQYAEYGAKDAAKEPADETANHGDIATTAVAETQGEDVSKATGIVESIGRSRKDGSSPRRPLSSLNVNTIRSSASLTVGLANDEDKAGKPAKPLFFSNYGQYIRDKAVSMTRSAPTSRQATPELLVAAQRPRSAPNPLLKRKSSQEQYLVDEGARRLVPQQKRQRVSQSQAFHSQIINRADDLAECGNGSVDANECDTVQDTLLAKPNAKECPGKLREVSCNGNDSDLFPDVFSDLDFEEVEGEISEQLTHGEGTSKEHSSKPSPVILPVLVESFNGGLGDDDFLEADLEVPSAVERQQSLGQMPGPDTQHQRSSDSPRLQSPELPRQRSTPAQAESSLHKVSNKGTESSTQSFTFELSSNDLAELDGGVKFHTKNCNSSQEPEDSLRMEMPSSDDIFEFPGCTQAFVALDDTIGVVNSIGRPAVRPPSNLQTVSLHRQALAPKRPSYTSMAPLPPPSRVARLSSVTRAMTSLDRDEYDIYFVGSTQALLKL